MEVQHPSHSQNQSLQIGRGNWPEDLPATCSRHHATIQDPFVGVEVKVVGTNPLSVKSDGEKKSVLRGENVRLRPGDILGLGALAYTVSLNPLNAEPPNLQPHDDDGSEEELALRKPSGDILLEKNEKKNRPICQYGAKCYRKNPDHWVEFAHPAQDEEEQAEEEPPFPPGYCRYFPLGHCKLGDKCPLSHDPLPKGQPPGNSKAGGGKGPQQGKGKGYGQGQGQAKKEENAFLGKTICLTGRLTQFVRRDVTARLQALGANVTGSVSKKTDVLVCGDKPGSKLTKAEDLGVTIWTEDDLMQRLEGAEAPDESLIKKAPEKPGLLLANKWAGQDPTGWWLSEKLDGVRALWKDGRFVSRLGNEFQPPAWFTSTLPKVTLDGELWAGRGCFQSAVGIVRSPSSEKWARIKFMVFDAPELPGPFEARIAYVKEVVKGCAQAEAVQHRPCKNENDLTAALADVEAQKGEGVMLRQPNSTYVPTRSSTLLKVKNADDDDAVIIGYTKLAEGGRVGTLVCKRVSDGLKFNVGSGLNDYQRLHPPAIGSTIVFKFNGLTDAGVPRFPRFVGIRGD